MSGLVFIDNQLNFPVSSMYKEELASPLLLAGFQPWTIVTAQPLGSILEAKPLRQGQKTKILGRQSQSRSHLYHI